MKEKILFVVAIVFCCSVGAYAQEDGMRQEMITDRPDETEAPSLVPRRFLQIETGFYYTEFDRDGFQEKVTGYNTTLLRYGLLQNLELRLGADLERREVLPSGAGDQNTGLSPLLVGAKVGITDGEGILPQIGLMGHINLPFTAHEAFRPETTGIGFRFAFSHDLSEDSDFSYNLGARWRDDSAEASYIYTAAYGWDITDSFGIFAEVYGDFPENGRASHHWDAGLTYLLQYNLQLDAYVGTGINNTQDLLLGGGISYRIPR